MNVRIDSTHLPNTSGGMAKTALTRQYGIDNSIHTNVVSTNFANVVSQAFSNNSATDAVLTELQKKYGVQIIIDALPNRHMDKQNFQSQLNNLGSRTFGTNHIVIAQNILEKMANDPKTKQHYMNEIQSYFATRPQAQAFMAMHGRQVVSSGIIVHEDGTVTSWSSSDYTPEEKARLERAMKEEDEEKAKKRAEEKRQIEIFYAASVRFIGNDETWLRMLQSRQPFLVAQG